MKKNCLAGIFAGDSTGVIPTAFRTLVVAHPFELGGWRSPCVSPGPVQ